MNENFGVVLLMFPPSSMRRLIFFLPFCIARISDEVCDRYRTTSLNSALISSHCDDIGLCHGLGVTCITAFYSLINLQKRKIEIAPIIDEISSGEQLNNRRIEAQLRAGPTIEDDLRAYSSDLAGLFWLVDSLTERIMDSFPYILYDAESDQNLLRDVIKEAEEVSCEIDRTEDPHEFRVAIHESQWFVKWTWTVRLMFNHLTWSGKSIAETEALFFAFAPFLHAYLHASFILKIHHNRVFEDRASWDVINTLVQYHPRYTADDGVWYLRMENSWITYVAGQRDVLPLDSTDVENIMAPMLSLSGIPYVQDPTTGRFQLDWDRIMSPSSALDYVNIEVIHYMYRVIRENHGDAAFSRIPDQIFRGTVFRQTSRASLAVADLINSIVPAHVLLTQLVPLSTAIVGPPVPTFIRAHRSEIFTQSIHQIYRMELFALHQPLRIFINDEPWTVAEWIQDVLFSIFDPITGFIVTLNSKASGDRFDLRTTSVAVGRILGLAIRYCQGKTLFTHLRLLHRPTEDTRNIFEIFFLNSFDVRAGFYDIYHDNMLEHLFRNNGTRFLEALAN